MENERGPRTIRLLTLNLRQGGRSRIEGVVRTVLGHRPDIAVLTEYRATPGPALGAQLAAGGLVHQASSEPERPKNGVFVAARLPFRVFPDACHPSPSPRHWLQVRFAHFDLGAIYAVYGVRKCGVRAVAGRCDVAEPPAEPHPGGRSELAGGWRRRE
ncbi:hypothetical protein [Candidatus Amarolinea dominans]|uniref:hypothetical protein n=1 Tax=Candidatus Amarolinea dominans TaxID=3140696 RepID=UPI001D210AB4|nr:endonuclease/exonuclease/phosphatase family protein [Anaerolineae bacterium]